MDIWETIYKRLNNSTIKMIDNKEELNEEQKNSLDTLKTVNTEYVKTLDNLMAKYQKNIAPLESQSITFWKIARQLEKANSRYPLGQYAHYYFRDFREPTEPFTDEWGSKNINYEQITEETKEIIEGKIPDYDNFKRLLQELIDELKDLLSDIITRNFIATRFVGLSEKYLELKKCDELWWFPQKIVIDKYSRYSVCTLDYHLPVTIPYHRELMIKYETIFDTSYIIKNKIKTIKQILTTIIYYLPFATLLPDPKPQQIIHIENTAKSEPISVGDNNTFEKDAAIGQGAEIEKRN